MREIQRITELKNLIHILCDNILDQPAGCDGCGLYEDGNCAKETLYKKMKEESEE